MIEIPTFAEINLWVALPVVFLALYTMVLLVADLFIPEDRKIVTARLTMFALVVAFILNLAAYNSEETAFGGMFIADQFTGFLNIVTLVTAFITILISVDYMPRTNIKIGEYYPLLLFSVVGMMLMASANDLIVIFIALEILSIPLYVMSAMRPRDVKGEESGMKYFIMGAFSSAFLIYGAALIYGATGTSNLPDIFVAVQDIIGQDSTAIYYLAVGAGLILVGLGFKVAVVPFHMWTPDVYEGAPTPVVAFMSVGAKVGGFGALLRVVIIALPAFVFRGDDAAAWQSSVWIISALTMILANIVAISQTNVKRLLAYSSIAHAGYILMAVAALGAQSGDLTMHGVVTTVGMGGTGDPIFEGGTSLKFYFPAGPAVQGALIYLLAYAFTNLGAFAVAIAIEKNDGSGTDLEDFVGLASSRPLMALMMAVFMLSLIGVPLTGGFVGKWFVFQAAIEAGLVPLAIIGVLTSVVSAFYYVRIIVNMYLREGEGDPARGASPYLNWGLYAAFSGTLLLGIAPILATDLLDKMIIVTRFVTG